MLNKILPILISSICGLVSLDVSAHFQLIYHPESLQQKSGLLTLKMPFTHPGSNGHVMDMEKPEAFYVVKKGQKTDLLGSLQEITWSSAVNTGKAWQATVKQHGLGDYIYVLQAQPYYEASGKIYIQQISKNIINVGGLPTGWDKPLNLKAEILPLQAPYSVYAGGSFTGVVLSNGKPVANAEIEVQYLNFKPDINRNAFASQPTHAYPNKVYEALSIRADSNGKFTFGIPKAGIWGFSAIGIGPDRQYKGKALSQDAVLWVQARNLGN